jgi:hypothetical protein
MSGHRTAARFLSLPAAIRLSYWSMIVTLESCLATVVPRRVAKEVAATPKGVNEAV